GDAVYVTGSSDANSAISPDYATIAYNAATGATLWVSRYNGYSNDYAAAVTVSPGGDAAYVTGGRDRRRRTEHYKYHGTLVRRRPRRHAVGQPVQRADRRRRLRHGGGGQPRRGRGVRHRGKRRDRLGLRLRHGRLRRRHRRHAVGQPV